MVIGAFRSFTYVRVHAGIMLRSKWRSARRMHDERDGTGNINRSIITAKEYIDLLYRYRDRHLLKTAKRGATTATTATTAVVVVAPERAACAARTLSSTAPEGAGTTSARTA